MNDNDRELIRMIRESEDPAGAIAIAVDVLQRLISGESEQSIAASYGVKLEEVTV